MAKMINNNSISEMVSELGYGFCASVEDCKSHLLNIGACELAPLVVAQIIGVMVRTHSSLSDPVNLQPLSNSNVWNDGKEKLDSSILTTWNMNFFVEALEEVVPSIDWKEIIQELDHPGFVVKDRQGLKILKHTLLVGLKNEEFSTQNLLKPWRNTEGQLSLIQLSLKNPDVFSFADYSSRTVALEMLKAPPDDDNREIAVWKSLDLVETLLYLSDTGQFVPVRKILQYPIQHCPDVFIMNLLQINVQMNLMRQELLTNLVPIFLSNHPNSASILQYAWHNVSNTTAVRNIIMRAMPDWYVRGESDQSRLSRILDVAQDLKALSALLNGTHLPFVIDLACLASRREYLKLDKWLTDKIREHGDQFIQACVAFLKRRCPQIIGGLVKEENLPKNAQLPPETLSTMLSCLQARAGNVSQELSEAILTMVGNCNILLNKPRQPPPGVVKTPRGLEPAFSSSSLIPNASPSSAPLDPLVSGIGAGISGLNIGSGTNNRIGSATTTVNSANSGVGNVFPLPGNFSAFANTPTSPAKIMFSDDMTNIFPESVNVSKEVEEEANKYFACIYSTPPTMSVDDLLEMFKRFKDSPVQMERDIFTCMIRYLFEEYKFFPKYPEKDLHINAQLFGGIIEHNLVTYMALGWALRCTLDSLKRPPNCSMFKFGITALERCKNRLKEYPQYCQHLAIIPHFNDFPSNLREAIEYGSRSQEPPSGRSHTSAVSSTVTTSNDSSTIPPVVQASALPASSSVVSTKSNAAILSSGTNLQTSAIGTKPSIANATNIDTLLGATEKDEKIKVPPEAIQDKVAFVVNNLSVANMPKKCEDIKVVLTETYWPWLSQYMVMNRISIEPNFHSLYANFLDALKLIKLLEMVIQETYRNINVLLQSDKTHANFSDRSLLKNLGHWLGILTLARDKPILQLDLDVKGLLIEAYHKGNQELLYVVPFIAKILDSCAKSRVFKPPNPWTVGIMRVLAELHVEPELKLNLKFEIEVLCKTLELDLNTLQPGNTLKDSEKLALIEPQLSQSSSHSKELALVQRIAVNSTPSVIHPVVQEEHNPHLGGIQHFGVNPSTNTGFNTPTSMFFNTNAPQSTIPTSMGPGPIPPTNAPLPHFTFNDFNISNLPNLSQYTTINNNIILFQQHPQLKQLVGQSVEKSVQDWIVQVVDRAIKISLTTAEQIVKKCLIVNMLVTSPVNLAFNLEEIGKEFLFADSDSIGSQDCKYVKSTKIGPRERA
ncbi:CCR4-NOT transcription complex subunit 1 [Nymphon striatum]|nr:CCR4-NOT transcription complex subunit 1 [Nymphon striatum]